MKRIRLFDLQFWAAPSVEAVAAHIIKMSDGDKKHKLLITPNAYIIQLLHKPQYADLLQYAQSADFILPDGMPVVWLSKLINPKDHLPARLTGSDLFPVLWQQIKTNGFKATFILPDIDTSEFFLKEYPHGCNTFVPDFFSEKDNQYIDFIADAAVELITNQQSDFLFIGISDPKQSLISRQVSEKLKISGYPKGITIGLLGASFQFYLGKIERAPKWMSKLGLEWLFRFAKEPVRLWKRYTSDNLRFIHLGYKEWKSKSSLRNP